MTLKPLKITSPTGSDIEVGFNRELVIKPLCNRSYDHSMKMAELIAKYRQIQNQVDF